MPDLEPFTHPVLPVSALDGAAAQSGRDVFVGAYADLVAQWRAGAAQRQADLAALDRLHPADLPAEGALTPMLDPRKVDRFCRLMGQEGWSAQSAKMRFDPLYARELLALGHSSASADLRRLALELFRLYEAQRVWH